MKFKIRGKNVEVTDAIKNYLKDKTGKLDDGRRYIKIATNNTEEKSLTIRC